MAWVGGALDGMLDVPREGEGSGEGELGRIVLPAFEETAITIWGWF